MGFHLQQDLVYETIIWSFLLQLFELPVDLLSLSALERVFLLLSEEVILHFRPNCLFSLLRVLPGIDSLLISLQNDTNFIQILLRLLQLLKLISLILKRPRHLNLQYQQQTEIEMGFEQVKYMLTAFRTKKTYLIFHISQLFLSVAIIITALCSKNHFKTPLVLILELILFLTLAFDLLVVRWITEGKLCQNRINIFDLGLLCIFAATLIFLICYAEVGQEKDYREIVETDDVIILIIVIGRYVGQVISLILTIRNSTANRQIHKQIKNVNLNNIELNFSANFGEAIKADQMVREKMKAKHALVEQL